jgi:hypothetical protein
LAGHGGIDLFPFMRLAFIFLPPEPTPTVSRRLLTP